MALLQQLERNEDSNEKQKEIDTDRAFEIMDIIMFSKECIKKVLQQAFSPASNVEESRNENRCGDCWVCLEEKEPQFSRMAVTSILSANAFNGKTSTPKEVLDLLNKNSERIWPTAVNGRKANSNNSEFLLVQLVTAKIVGYKQREDQGKTKGPRRLAMELFWNKTGEYPNCRMAYDDNDTWDKFGNVVSEKDILELELLSR